MSRALKLPKQRAEPTDGAGVKIDSPADIVSARKLARDLSAKLGFASSDVTLIAAAISEITQNIVDYAGHGEIMFTPVHEGRKEGLLIVAHDEGPGIPDVEQAMQYGYSSRHGAGVGLPGTKWLMDEFEIVSAPGEGTTVTMKKWLNGSCETRA